MSDRLLTRVRRVAGAPVVSLRVWLRGGARVETIPGQALLAGRMLAEGSRERTWRQIAEDAENRGAALNSAGSVDVHGLAIDALAADWPLALEWAAELVREPAFPADRFDWLRRQTAAELESLADQPDVVSGWGFLAQLYHPHPRSYPLQGSRESLATLTTADCASFHARSLAEGMVIAVAGDVPEEAVRTRVEALFGGLSNDLERHREAPAPAGLEDRHREVPTPATDQAHLYVGHLTVPRGHSDYPALQLVSVVLGSGAGLTGRIPARIREREGLAYTAYAHTTAGAGFDAGRLVAYVGTSPATVEQAERGVREELARLVAHGLEAHELAEARSYLLGREPFRRETARQWAEMLADAGLYGTQGDDPAWVAARLNEVDLAWANAAIARHIRPQDLRVTVGMPAGEDEEEDDDSLI